MFLRAANARGAKRPGIRKTGEPEMRNAVGGKAVWEKRNGKRKNLTRSWQS